MPPDTATPAAPTARAIFCHFDDYSTALFFARWPDRSLLWPAPVPDAEARPGEAPLDPASDPEALRRAALASLPFDDAEVEHIGAFQNHLMHGDTPVAVHLYRLRTFEAPTPAIAAAGGSFRQLPELRGSAPCELSLLREVFNHFVGGSGRLSR